MQRAERTLGKRFNGHNNDLAQDTKRLNKEGNTIKWMELVKQMN